MGSSAEGIWIQTLGRFGVVAAGREVPEARRQPVRSALLVYLAMEREVTRDRLLGVFWPDRTEAQGRHALSQTLHKLRRDLEKDWVQAEGEALLAADVLEIDARAFERAVAREEHGAALGLYAGHFLEGWRLHETHEFELWVDQQRARLSRLLAVASRDHIREREAEGDLESSLAAARRWASLSPRDDTAQAALIELLARSGLASEAMRQYQEFRNLRAAENLEPEPEIASRIVASLARKPAVPSAAAPIADACVLVLPFENLTGRDELGPLGRMAADWITEGLDRTGMVRIVPALDALRTIRAAIPSAGGDARVRLLELARESHAGILICGSYYAVDSGLEFQAQIVDIGSGELRGTVEPVRVPTDQTAKGVSLLRERVLGLLAATLDKDWRGMPTPPELGVRPPTYDAYRAYTRGVENFLMEEFAAAVSSLEQAMGLDPGFTRPILLAAAAHGNLGHWERVEPLIEALESVSDRLSPYEAASLRWHRTRLAGDREGAYATASMAWRRYPGTIAHFVAGLSALEVNRPGVTIAIYRSLDPERGWTRQFHRYWDVLTAAHHMAGDHERELEMARRSRSRFPALLSTLAHEVRALAALGEIGALDDPLAAARDLPPQHGWSHGKVLMTAAEEARAHGQPKAAAAWAEAAIDRFRRDSTSGPLGAPARSELAHSLYAAGCWEEAEALFRGLAAEFPQNLDYRGRLGVLAARRGDAHEAAGADRELKTLCRPFLFGRHTLWRARIGAQLGGGDSSVELLRRAFAEGLAFGLELHTDLDLEPLRTQASFQELMRPKA